MSNRIIWFVTSAFLIALVLLFNAWQNSQGASYTDAAAIPNVYNKLYGAYYAGIEGEFVVIKVHSRPDHKSPYYSGTQWQNELYEAYNGTNPNWMQNPHHIAETDLTFRIPLHPQAATNHQSTPLGPIGVSLNGVPFFNQYAGNGQPLTNEINSFDQYLGHPAPNNMYHYHAEPYYLTAHNGSDALMGFLLDGFPVYGPMENGHTMTNDSLDSYHGHFSVTKEYPNGIYHYHITGNAPYINGDGFYGTPGTVTQ